MFVVFDDDTVSDLPAFFWPEFMSRCENHIFSLNGHDFGSVQLHSGDAVHFEICEDPMMFSAKLFQLERELRVARCCSGIPRPVAIGLILDNNPSEFNAAVQRLQQSWTIQGSNNFKAGLEISLLPCFLVCIPIVDP